jgi:hypothetical protein
MQENDVGFVVLPEYSDGFAVRGIMERLDRVGLKIRDLAASGSVKRLEQ